MRQNVDCSYVHVYIWTFMKRDLRYTYDYSWKETWRIYIWTVKLLLSHIATRRKETSLCLDVYFHRQTGLFWWICRSLFMSICRCLFMDVYFRRWTGLFLWLFAVLFSWACADLFSWKKKNIHFREYLQISFHECWSFLQVSFLVTRLCQRILDHTDDVFMWIYICIYMHIYAHVCVYIYIYIYIYMYICIYTYIYICIYICMYV